MSLPPKLRDLVDTLELVGDRNDRIDYLIDVASRFREVPPRVATRPFADDHKVPACESQAYVWAEPRDDGTLDFHFAVENPQGISARAMAVVLDETLSGEPLEEVAQVDGDVVYHLFGDELSMGKSLGLQAMVSMVARSARQAIAS